MRTMDFHRWLAQATELTSSQREQAWAWLRENRAGDEGVAMLLDRAPRCPHCHHPQGIHWGTAHGLARYRCRVCHRTFNALTGTPLARLRHRARWAAYAQALIDGVSVREAARRCGVHKNTAFR